MINEEEKNISKRLKRLYKLMEEHDLESLVLTNWPNVRYTTGYWMINFPQALAPSIFYTAILFKNELPVLLVTPGDMGRLKDNHWIKDIRLFPSELKQQVKSIADVIREYGIDTTKIALDMKYTPADFYLELRKELCIESFFDSGTLLFECRTIKFSDEIKLIRESATICDKGIEAALSLAQNPGHSEKEIYTQACTAALTGKADLIAGNIVISGPNTGLLNYKRYATDRVVNSGEFMMIDFGVVYNGYCSDITRTIPCGNISQDKENAFNLVKDTLKMMINAIGPGKNLLTIDQIARHNIIDKAGYSAKNYSISVWPGHGIGLSLHEPPFLGKGDFMLKPGMVLCIEPGIYMDDWGLRIEEMVLVTETGAEILSHSSMGIS